VGTIFCDNNRDTDHFRALALLTTMEEAIARHTADVASTTTTGSSSSSNVPPAG
jgi:hypothetical protein